MSAQKRNQARRRRPSDSELADGGGDMQKRIRGPNASSPGSGRRPEESADNLYFEDPFGDDMEEDEAEMELGEHQGDEGDEDEVMGASEEDEEENAPKERPRVWRPGVDSLEEGEELVFDNSAYTAFHRFELPWPCLSVDVVTDSLGPARTKFPQTLFLAAGTQADQGQQNHVYLLKLSDIHRTVHDDDSDPDDDDEDLDDDPVFSAKAIEHPGGVNRIRSQRQESQNIATWSDDGHVYIWNCSEQLLSLDDPVHPQPPQRQRPVFVSPANTHTTEGFAMDWSKQTKGQLLTGDNNGKIVRWEPREATWAPATQYQVERSSVEDLQWSPVQKQVFASCGTDRSIRIWDSRKPQAMFNLQNAHDADVNVISWNTKDTFLLASGGDDGVLKIWDLRKFQKEIAQSCVGMFNWHQNHAITSLQWHPDDPSIIACSSADNTVSFWDLALEADDEQGDPDELKDVPPQLLFHHQGQQEIKELVFHPQIPSLVVSTANSGFHLFKPSNMS